MILKKILKLLLIYNSEKNIYNYENANEDQDMVLQLDEQLLNSDEQIVTQKIK